jgi:DNA-binding cell septation regulator SpoVG
MIFVGRTPVFYQSKRQGAIETSTYSAEFNGARTATEETIAVRYMLRCLGVKVTHPTYLFGDNLGVVQNDSLLKKKHVAISYHKVREAAAAGIVHPIKIDTKDNISDLMTKSLTQKIFSYLVGMISYG